ncbi:TIR domain-containing protein [Streptomyces sp. MN03-5084-2B]|nr:TIR domain-containing protein [Streptomyces sp. MN03-5084-2B]
MPTSVEAPQFDVFLSCCGSDRGQVRALAGAMRQIGIRVFLDEEIRRFSGISDSIATALSSSKTLVAYYSASYATRAACQYELMTAFLAGQREGNPLHRVLVINPEPNNRHLAPAELADAFFALPASTLGELASLASDIKQKILEIKTAIGEVGPLTRPGPRASDTFGFIGRYRELWDLHSSLSAPSFPLTHTWISNSIVSVCGLPGTGKSALVAAYATRFHAAHPTGTRWTSLANTSSADEAADKYTSTVADFGSCCDSDRPGLLVVDDVPANFDFRTVDHLAPPAGLKITLISNENIFDSLLPVIKLGPLELDDAITMLSRNRPADNDDEAGALSKVAQLVGCHPGALTTVVRHLKDRQGLLSYTEYARKILARTPLAAELYAPFEGMISRLDPDEQFMLHAALLTNSNVIPARLFSKLEQSDPGATLTRLRRRMIAKRDNTLWSFEQIIISAFRQLDDCLTVDQKTKNLVTCAIIDLMTDPEISAEEWCCLAEISNCLTRSDSDVSDVPPPSAKAARFH